MLDKVVHLVLGAKGEAGDPWQRLEKAFEMLAISDTEDCRRLESACFEAMIRTGLDREWVEADYDNIDELLMGELGPLP